MTSTLLIRRSYLSKTIARWSATAFFCCALASSITSSLAQSLEEEKDLVSIHFPEQIDISNLIKAVSLWTGKQIMLDPSVKGQIQIIAPKKVHPEEAYQIFLSALNNLDLTTIETGKLIKIVKKNIATKENLRVYKGSENIPETDMIVTYVFYLHNISANDSRLIIGKLMPASSVVAYEPTNALIVSDTGRGIKRFEKILNELDHASKQSRLIDIKIRHASVKFILDTLNQLAREEKGKTNNKHVFSSFIFSMDEASNTLFAFGRKDFESILKQTVMDLDAQKLTSKTNDHYYGFFVRPLAFSDAKKMLQVLESVKDASGDKTEKSKQIKLSADESTNSIIIKGEKSAFLSIDNIIKKLDEQKAQVLIEVSILDFTSEDDFRAAASLLGGYAKSDGSGNKTIAGFEAEKMAPMVIASSSASDTISNQNKNQVASVFAQELTVGLLPAKGINLPGLGNFSPGALLRLIKSDGRANIVSKPYILTIENEEALVSVGETVMYQTVDTTMPDRIVQKLQREKADLSLKVRPQISKRTDIFLDLAIEANDIAGYAAQGIPKIVKRKATQKVMATDGQMIVISGLEKEAESMSEKKVPFLSQIPLLGVFFRQTEVKKAKSRLILTLTPHIVRGSDDLIKLYKTKAWEDLIHLKSEAKGQENSQAFKE